MPPKNKITTFSDLLVDKLLVVSSRGCKCVHVGSLPEDLDMGLCLGPCILQSVYCSVLKIMLGGSVLFCKLSAFRGVWSHAKS